MNWIEMHDLKHTISDHLSGMLTGLGSIKMKILSDICVDKFCILGNVHEA